MQNRWAEMEELPKQRTRNDLRLISPLNIQSDEKNHLKWLNLMRSSWSMMRSRELMTACKAVRVRWGDGEHKLQVEAYQLASIFGSAEIGGMLKSGDKGQCPLGPEDLSQKLRSHGKWEGSWYYLPQHYLEQKKNSRNMPGRPLCWWRWGRMKHSNSSNSSKNRMSGEAMYYEYPRVNFYPESDLKKLLITNI